MKKSQLFIQFPEYYLVILTILAMYKQPIMVSVVLASIIVLLVLQIIYQNWVTGFIFAAVLFFINLFFLGALISELSEFSELTAAAVQLISVGLTIVIVNFMASGVMIYKYGFIEEKGIFDRPAL